MAGNYLSTDIRDIRFVLLEQVGIQDLLRVERFKDLTTETVEMIVEESDRMAREVLAPINAKADHAGGVKLIDGQAYAPEGYKEAYDTLCQAGWIGLSLKSEYGGQDVPNFVRAASDECFVAANPSLHTYPGLTTAAARVIESFGTDEQKALYLPKMLTGEWTGTMCLTEPGAGSDIGDIRTSAKKFGDHYKVRGTKQFITGGDTDMAENVIHLVLARAEGAPKGVIGISLFIVPKYKVNPDGSIGPRNDVNTAAIEKKMGLKGSATAQLQFGEAEDCEGYILGGEGEGLLFMFQMMYEARIGVGHQALSMSSAAYEYAYQYAHERYQGSAVERMGDPNAPRVLIVNHPDVRRMLMEAKSYVAAMRRIIYYVSQVTDRAWNLPKGDPEQKWCLEMCQLLIPVAKAYATDRALDTTNLAMLIYGGYGYIQEYPVEQYLRDVKVTAVYEGTNGIQAIDLLLRNCLARRGKALKTYMAEVEKTIDQYGENPRLNELFNEFVAAKNELMSTTEQLQGKRQTNILHLLLAATPYMEMFGHILSAHMLLWSAGVADEKLQAIFEAKGANTDEARKAVLEGDSEAAYYHNNVQTARFFIYYVLPKVYTLSKIIRKGDQAPMDAVL